MLQLMSEKDAELVPRLWTKGCFEFATINNFSCYLIFNQRVHFTWQHSWKFNYLLKLILSREAPPGGTCLNSQGAPLNDAKSERSEEENEPRNNLDTNQQALTVVLLCLSWLLINK